MTGRGLTGLVLALVVEAAHWTRLRWPFDDSACVRAWRITVFATALTIVWMWIDGNPYMAVPRTLGWLPALLLPLQFVQSYGLRDSMWLHTFSFFGHSHRARNPHLGLAASEVKLNFGHVYLVAILLGSTPLDGVPDSRLFLPGLAVLSGWGLLASRRCRWPQVLVLTAAAWGLGLAGQHGLERVQRWYQRSWYRDFQSGMAPDHFRTAIGRLGEIKQSPDIAWRMRTLGGTPAPGHLRTASYNRYASGLWSNLPPQEKDGVPTRGEDADFDVLQPVDLPDGSTLLPVRDKGGPEAARPELPRFTLRGAAANNSALPVPGNAAGLIGFDVESIERNSLGTVRIFPKAGIADGTVTWNDAANPELPPWQEVDLGIHEPERNALRQTLESLKLAEAPSLDAKLSILKRFFQSFEYTRYSAIRAPRVGASRGATAIGQFLTTQRRGHCEYFATAACLLLRQAGIPARYAIGFSVSEFDSKRREWVIRGLHGHAWARVWDASRGLWIDFDPTPAGWLPAETSDRRRFQWLADFMQRTNEDFNLWRSRPGNRMLVSTLMLVIGTSGLAIVLRRLWRSKQQVGPDRPRLVVASGRLTPLHRLEKPANRHLPPRPPGHPLAAWLCGLRGVLPDPAPLDEAIALHQRLRFDPQAPPPESALRLARLCAQLEASLRRVRRHPPAAGPPSRGPS